MAKRERAKLRTFDSLWSERRLAGWTVPCTWRKPINKEGDGVTGDLCDPRRKRIFIDPRAAATDDGVRSGLLHEMAHAASGCTDHWGDGARWTDM